MRRAHFALVTIAGTLLSASAHSTTCALPPIVFPRPGETAPLNTHVFVRSIGIAPDSIELRVASTGEVVEVTQSKRDEGETWYELTPKKNLAPSTRYDVIEHRGAAPPYPRRRFIVGTFTTTTAIDTTPPKWRGPLTGEFRVLSRQQVVVIDMFEHRDYLAFKGDAAEDDATSPDSIRYAVWLEQSAGQGIDFTKPPDWVRAAAKIVPDGAKKALFTLGSVFICDANGFDVEPLKKKKKVIKVGVKPIDLAGNYGDARELAVDMTKTVPAR